MLRLSRTLTGRDMIFFMGIFLLIGLQGCDFHIYHHGRLDKMVGDGRTTVPAGPDDCGAKGCDPTAYSGYATGFVGIGGTSPVPDILPLGNDPNDYTCNAGSVKCGNEGASGCSLRYPNKVCKTTFTYQSGSKEGPCACQCLNP